MSLSPLAYYQTLSFALSNTLTPIIEAIKVSLMSLLLKLSNALTPISYHTLSQPLSHTLTPIITHSHSHYHTLSQPLSHTLTACITSHSEWATSDSLSCSLWPSPGALRFSRFARCCMRMHTLGFMLHTSVLTISHVQIPILKHSISNINK